MIANGINIRHHLLAIDMKIVEPLRYEKLQFHELAAGNVDGLACQIG